MTAAGDETERPQETGAPPATVFAPMLSHLVYVLIGFAWPAFGLIYFVLLLSGATLNFSFPLVYIFPVVCLLALLFGHLIALNLESTWMTKALHFFRRGMPLVFYRRFARIETETGDGGQSEPAIVFGARRVLLSAVDQLHLTFLGVLELRTFKTSGRVLKAGGGEPLNEPDLLARVPLGVLSPAEQIRLVDTFRASSPTLTINKRLEDRLNSPIVKGQAMISIIGAVVFLWALFDVGYAVYHLQGIQKDYYGSQLCVRHPDKAEKFIAADDGKPADKVAVDLYNRAEDARLHPAPLSWAYRALFANGHSAAPIMAARAETLYWLGRRDEAIKSLQDAIELKPSGYHIQLQLARILAEYDRRKEARAVMDAVLEKHKDVLLPRIYNYAMLAEDHKAAGELYKEYLSQLDDDVFGEEPAWPPGERPIMELFSRQDLEFLVPLFSPGTKH